MLIFDFYEIGNKLYEIRKRRGMTQAELAEAAGLSDRTYADIERGSVNMRTETLLRICKVLSISPDEILTKDAPMIRKKQEKVLEKLNEASPAKRETAIQLLSIFLNYNEDDL